MDTLPSSIPNTVRHQAIYNFFLRERSEENLFANPKPPVLGREERGKSG